MTPKEKAAELVFKYWGNRITNVKKIAKECALIAVDEILTIGCVEVPYWQEVKQEIKKHDSN